ncbi:cytochrome c3 family protein [Rodentibacter caecimuris]|uniref:cytochrome c3 family protein n=1 Tax=Rodentibacter caecimuris TaxID=1796644 RepID=UPI00259096A4|nr:cytochrome c3 family protein [Rodentibacter heylii]
MSEKKPNFIVRFWHWFRKPSRLAVGTIISLAFIGGILSWIGFNYGLEKTNTEQFCASCHMNDAYPEYLHSVHYQTRTGVGASCPDCHVPHEFGPKMKRKIIAAKEVYAHYTGKVDTLEKFNQHRLAMAENEWARMKANDSQECRNCHNVDRMNFNEQRPVAAKMHEKIKIEGKTCIDCHKGIAHRLPDMSNVESGFKKETSDKAEK